MRALPIALLACSLAACDACGPHQVPFRLDAGTEAPVRVDLGRPAAPAFEPVDSRELPAGTRSVDVEGAAVTVATGSLRAVLAFDVDDDGDRDAVLITADDPAVPPSPPSSARLAFASRDGAAFAPTSILTPLPLPAGCQMEHASVRALSLHWAVATLAATCVAPDGTPAPAPPAVTWLVSLAARPRLRERIALLPPAGRAGGDVAIGARIADADGDARDDVRLDVSVTLPPTADVVGRAAACGHASATITWLDRPAGLARDTHEPEASLRSAAQGAKQGLRHEDVAGCALQTARAVLALHDVICREGPGPRISFGEGEGVACGASRGAGIAQSVVAIATARRGDVLGALAAQASLASPSLDVPRADRDAATRAIAALPSEPGATWLVGPAHTLASGPDVRLPAMGFLPDGTTMVLRGPGSRLWTIGAGSEPTIIEGPQADWLVRSPSNAHAIVDVHRACDGFHLGVVAAANVVQGVVVGHYVHEPLAVAAPMTGDCTHLPENVRLDPGGIVVLGWAPQGAVVVRGTAIYVVPLDGEGNALSAPQPIAPGAAMPAPLPYGAATPDGRALAIATPQGVLVRELVPQARTVLLRPAEWAATPGDVTDVAISSDARRVAVVKGGVVYVITRGG